MADPTPTEPATEPPIKKREDLTPEYMQREVAAYNARQRGRFNFDEMPDPQLMDPRRANDRGLIEMRKRQHHMLDQTQEKLLRSYPNMSPQAQGELRKFIDFQKKTYDTKMLIVDPREAANWDRNRHFQYHSQYAAFLDPESKRAIEMAGADMRPGLLSNVTKNFYDESKGGMQWGGIAGGVVGLLAGMYMGSQAGGGWISWLITAMTTIGFAYGGNKLAEYMSGPEVQPFQAPPANGTSPARTASRGPAQQQDVETPSNDPTKIAAAYERGTGTQSERPISERDYGNLTSQQFTVNQSDQTPTPGSRSV